MKYFFSIPVLLLAASFALAEPTDATSGVPSQAERDQQRAHLATQRQRIEDQYKDSMKLCYQKFDVNSCRLEARERRIEASNLLRKEELKFNASERLIESERAKRNLAERHNESTRKEADTDRAAAIAASKERVDRNSQKQIDHALQGTKRGDYEQKQREAAEHRAAIEKRMRERNKEPAAPLPVPSR